MSTLDDLIKARVPGVRTRTLHTAFNRARPDAFQHAVSGFTRTDDASIRRLQTTLESIPSVLEWRSILAALGNPRTGGDFERALRERLLRIVEDTVEIIPSIQRDRRKNPALDLSGLPTMPTIDDDRPVTVARYLASHGDAHGVLHLASYDPVTGFLMTWEVWKHPGGGRGGSWREQHLEDLSEGWIRDPQ